MTENLVSWTIFVQIGRQVNLLLNENSDTSKIRTLERKIVLKQPFFRVCWTPFAIGSNMDVKIFIFQWDKQCH